MNRATRRVTCLALILLCGGAMAPPSHAKGDALGALILGGAALMYAGAVAVIGVTALAVQGARALAQDGPGAALPPRPAAESPRPGAPPDGAEAARREFLARPTCSSVGGYEAYLKSTGRFCRLH
jgi:hypothetical protein